MQRLPHDVANRNDKQFIASRRHSTLRKLRPLFVFAGYNPSEHNSCFWRSRQQVTRRYGNSADQLTTPIFPHNHTPLLLAVWRGAPHLPHRTQLGGRMHRSARPISPLWQNCAVPRMSLVINNSNQNRRNNPRGQSALLLSSQIPHNAHHDLAIFMRKLRIKSTKEQFSVLQRSF